MKKIISLLLAIFVLCACSVSTSSSNTTTISTTDSSGNTTTTTTTTENGVTTTDTITSSEDDYFVIIDVEGETILPFYLLDTPVENGFEIAFKDGDAAQMQFVDTDTIIDDMVSIWESVKTAQ